jgi:hypothetical protein
LATLLACNSHHGPAYPTRLPRKFLTTWVSHLRRSGGQHYTLRNSYVKTLQHILPNIPDNGTIHQGREFIANGALENGAFCTVFSENFHKF